MKWAPCYPGGKVTPFWSIPNGSSVIRGSIPASIRSTLSWSERWGPMSTLSSSADGFAWKTTSSRQSTCQCCFARSAVSARKACLRNVVRAPIYWRASSRICRNGTPAGKGNPNKPPSTRSAADGDVGRADFRHPVLHGTALLTSVQRRADERSVPIPAVSNCNKVCRQTLYLLDYLVGAPDQRRRHGEAQRLCSLEIDHQLKASWVAPPEGRPASRPSRSWPHRWRRAYTYPGCLHRTI